MVKLVKGIKLDKSVLQELLITQFKEFEDCEIYDIELRGEEVLFKLTKDQVPAIDMLFPETTIELNGGIAHA